MGERVDGYELLEPLGQGGMGIVYRARELETGRIVAFKLLLADELGEDLWRRFQREAEALARIRHPNVLRVHRAGRSRKGPYLVTELVAGEDLQARLKRAGALPPAEAVRLVARLADAVAALHRAGMIHRDIKPANVIVRPSGEPVLLDFGLVRVEGSSLTATGDLLGSPAFMSPEQAIGARHEVGPPADIYALGALAYTLLSGRAPFEGGLYEVLDQVVSAQPEWPSEVPGPLRAVLRRALEKDPRRRYPSVEAFGEALQQGESSSPLAGGGARLLAAVALGVGSSALALAWITGTTASPAPSPTPAPATASSPKPAPAASVSSSPPSPLERPPPASLDQAIERPCAARSWAGILGARHLPSGRVLGWGVWGSPPRATLLELSGDLRGEPLVRWSGPAEGVGRTWWAAAQTPDRRRLALGFYTHARKDRRVLRWSAERGVEAIRWRRKLDALAISPAGKTVYALHFREPRFRAELWVEEPAGGAPRKLGEVYLPEVAALSLLSEDRLLCVSREPREAGDKDLTKSRTVLELWDLERGRRETTVMQLGYARTFCADPSRTLGFVGTEQPPTGVLYRLPSFELIESLRPVEFKQTEGSLRGFRAPPSAACFDSRGRLIVAMGHGEIPAAGGRVVPRTSFLYVWQVSPAGATELGATCVEGETFHTLSLSPDEGWAVTSGVVGPQRARFSLWDLRPSE